MFTNFFLFTFFIGFLALQGCENKKDETYTKLKSFLEEDLKQPSGSYPKFVLIIPMKGCPSCIAPTTKYIKKKLQMNSSNIMVVLSDYGSKLMKIKFTEIELQNKFVFEDTKNKAFLKGLILSSPVLYKLNKQKILEEITLSPRNLTETFLNLDEELKREATNL